MPSNLKGLILITGLLGLANALVACTASADMDSFCVGQDKRCVEKAEKPPLPTAIPVDPVDNRNVVPGS